MAGNGEVLEFEEYVRTRQDALLRSARRLVPNPVDAQDLVQTALVRTYPRWEGIADKTLADAYMRRVMINTRTEWWRNRKLEEVPTGELPDASVDDGSEQRADREMLLDVMTVLAPKQRQVVMLRHYGQLSTQETARALGMSTGTVKSTLHRALARLRYELEHGRYGYSRLDAVDRDSAGRDASQPESAYSTHPAHSTDATGPLGAAAPLGTAGSTGSAGSTDPLDPATLGREPMERMEGVWAA
ncbi:SigE family RNA polymerase sigma factor [Streptomyces sp. NPDC088910]|uniref:SigE family RNA polymerase sigma factor n=1 Tax=Streptomyces sp. NPDC088910 TaxID=3365911 RepID=UPI00380B3057